MTDTAELERRLSEATWPDRILDAMLAADVAGLCLHGSWHSEGPESDRGRRCDDCGADSWGNLGRFGQRLNDPVPSYTASIDAALALVERRGGPLGIHWPWVLEQALALYDTLSSAPSDLSLLPRYICLCLIRALATNPQEPT